MAGSILVVEDEAAIRDLLAANLQRAGYRVMCAGDVPQAEALVRESRPDLVLLDWVLPGVPGLTFARHLDEFWNGPVPPEPGLYGAFRRVLVDRCLVRGGLASESAVRTLIESMLVRLGCSAEPAEPYFDRVEVADPIRRAE